MKWAYYDIRVCTTAMDPNNVCAENDDNFESEAILDGNLFNDHDGDETEKVFTSAKFMLSRYGQLRRCLTIVTDILIVDEMVMHISFMLICIEFHAAFLALGRSHSGV